MIISEAKWIRERLLELNPARIINCGSSTRHFREIEQPWITECLAGFDVLHLDKKEQDGVYIVCDLEEATDFSGSVGTADMVLLTSVLEHVVNRAVVLQNASQLTSRYLLVTVPREWPYHPDPIDTLYRPTIAELIADVEPFSYEAVNAAVLPDARGRCTAVLFQRKESTNDRNDAVA